jgi:Flp pilus assembly protein protease CpaA
MWATLILLTGLLIAAWTDARKGLIYNWTTYPGIVLGLAGQWLDGGTEALADGVRGLVVCGGVILFIFLFGGTGGGDVKLIAMLGACLGLYDGLEAMLWTFVLGAITALALLIWQFGAVSILQETWRHLKAVAIARRWLPLTATERAPLKRTLFLAPAAFLAVVLVRGEHVLHVLRPFRSV